MFEKASDLAEHDLYEHWCDIRSELSEKDLNLVDHLLDSLIDFAERYPEHEITGSFLRDLRGLD